MGQLVSDADFAAEVLNAKRAGAGRFLGRWCPPCKAMDPILDDLAVELAGKVKIVKLDVETNPSTVVDLQCARHADADGVQGRRAGRHQGRLRPVAGAADQMARELSPEARRPLPYAPRKRERDYA